MPCIGTDRLGRERDAHREKAGPQIDNGEHAADDLGLDPFLGDRVDRHFDALLDRDGARPRLDGARVASHLIGRMHDGTHEGPRCAAMRKCRPAFV